MDAQGLFKGEGIGIPNPLNFSQEHKPSFKNKKFGVEINPLYLLLLHRQEQLLSGTFSYFNHKNNVEYAFPVHYYKRDRIDASDYKQYTIDVHYRKFLNDKIGGVYFSGFTRVAYLEGDVYDYNHKTAKQTKVGFGGGVGYRYFSNNGFYWGANISLGAYVGSNRDLEYDAPMFFVGDDQALIIDIELIKFGWAF